MGRIRLKRKCGNCKHLADFPYVHCTIGAELSTEVYNDNGFVPMPDDPSECQELRQEQLELTG